jgi:excisionase family DNA binding protein
MHTPSSAARATGLAKSTIYRAIKTGRLPAHKLHSGTYAIYPAELCRAFPSAPLSSKAATVPSTNTLSFPRWDVG